MKKVIITEQIMDDEIKLVTDNCMFCNECEQNNMILGMGNEIAVGLLLNKPTAVYICQCGNVFIINNGIKKDVYSFNKDKHINS